MAELVIIAYDTPDDKRRLEIANALENFGDRVQYSVFEARLDAAQAERMRQCLERIVDPAEDGVRIYRICGACERRAAILGKGELLGKPDVFIL